MIEAIYPIVVGEQQTDGTFSASFFEDLLRGEIMGRKIPDVIPVKTISKARELLGMLPTPVQLTEELTVSKVISTILRFQALLVHSDNGTILEVVGKSKMPKDVDAQKIGFDCMVATCTKKIMMVVTSSSKQRRQGPSFQHHKIERPAPTRKRGLLRVQSC